MVQLTPTFLRLLASEKKKEKRIMVIECLFIAQDVDFVEDNLKTFTIDTGVPIGVILRRE